MGTNTGHGTGKEVFWKVVGLHKYKFVQKMTLNWLKIDTYPSGKECERLIGFFGMGTHWEMEFIGILYNSLFMCTGLVHKEYIALFLKTKTLK